MAEIWAFVGTLIKENSLITPFDEDWKNVFGLTPQKLFSDLEDMKIQHWEIKVCFLANNLSKK